MEYFFVPMICAIPCYLLVIGIWDTYQGIAALRWPEIEVVVVKTEIAEKWLSKRTPYFVPLIELETVMEGNVLRGRLKTDIAGSEETVANYLESYPLGSKHIVRMNPRNHTRMVAKAGATIRSIGMAIAGVISLGLVSWMLFFFGYF